MMKFIYIIIGLFAFSQIDAKERYYKWTDADGNVHYTSKKPIDKQADEVKVATSQPPSAKVVNRDEKDTNEDGSKKERTPEQKAIDDFNENEKAKATTKQNKENCKIARKNLATLQQTVRVRKTNPATGEVIRMDDTQRIKMMNEVKKSIKKLCK